MKKIKNILVCIPVYMALVWVLFAISFDIFTIFLDFTGSDIHITMDVYRKIFSKF
jgi:hypothetical protein